ncbi:hypothetical protein [Halomonas alimentaria]|uniref:hypothetical protein n=1 Tax=Halomonas alimentaria TaxID=147248 RepID=UPI00249378B5|nr:hypothetical protein [Halomonas alimentaria]
MTSRGEELLKLVLSWRQPPADPEAFVAALDLECSLCERFPPSPEMSRAEWLEAVDRFRLSMDQARRALDGLPAAARSMLGQHLALGEHASAWGAGSSAGPMEWPPLGEMLDALHEAAGWLVEDAPEQYARARPELSLVGIVARVCARHGVKVSSASDSRFLRVLGVILPGRDHRGLIRQAMDRGVISRPAG